MCKLNRLMEKSKEDSKNHDVEVNIYQKSLTDLKNQLEVANKKNKDLE